ncbi:MAG: hypothetical protein M3349_00920 [Actinomycetota bacterium]|nr:hypothetical protein [Actinomycetota bacterium]
MADLLIRDLDPAVHEELRRRADEAHVSLQAYVSRLLGQHAGRSTIAQWLRGLDDLARHPDVSGAAALRDARGDLP